MRRRTFSDPSRASTLGCDRQMVQKEMCGARIGLCEGDKNVILMASKSDSLSP